jgi:Ca2+-binding RTX toxin-like protein
MVRVMKRLLLMTIVVVALLGAPATQADGGVALVLQGGPESDFFSVELSADGRTYEIESNAALDVGAGVCWHPEAIASLLTCEAAPISGFELNGGKGTDTLTIGRRVAVAATLRGGSGDDVLTGGTAADKLIGGGGGDILAGGGGSDLISGSDGDDTLYGRSGNDKMLGGQGDDKLWGGSGNDTLIGGPGNDLLNPGTGTNVVKQQGA